MVATLQAIAAAVRRLQASGKKVVFTNGCFDILHSGHVDLLVRARSLGDALVVAINTDASVRRMKGPNRPIIPQDERAELLAGLDVVDFVCTFDEDTPLEAILSVRPTAGTEIDEAKRGRRMTGVVVSGLLVILIAAYLRRIY